MKSLTRTLLPSRSLFCRSPTDFFAASTSNLCRLLMPAGMRAAVIVCKGVPETRAICPSCVEIDIGLATRCVLRAGLALTAKGA